MDNTLTKERSRQQINSYEVDWADADRLGMYWTAFVFLDAIED